MNHTATENTVLEIEFHSEGNWPDPYNQIEMDILVTDREGTTIRHPAFWAGGSVWKARVTAPCAGECTYRSVCSEASDSGLHDRRGTLHFVPYGGDNPLLRHGRLQVANDKRHFEHHDGTPFFWVGDTWWMGLCKRLDFPDGFQSLVSDRVKKGFNVVQIVAGPYPDMDSWDPRGANEAGFPFTDGHQSINPTYYDLADLKLDSMVQSGIVPCIVGMWGYYLPWLGEETVKRFWRYLVARYGAHPVVWCMAGEATMPYYLSKTKKEDAVVQKAGWTKVTEYVRSIDGYRNLVTIHPTQYGREMVEDPALLDFEMLQTGHSDIESVPNTAKSVVRSVGREPVMPIVNSEVNYEGILGRCWQNVQRLCFYHSVLNGTAGHTYGANGIWQMSTQEEPYGPSPHGRCWGNTPWQEARDLPGSRQTGIGGRFIRRFPWWKFERHPEWVEPECDPSNAYSCVATGIPRELRIVYIPMLWDPPKIKAIEPDVKYKAWYFDPVRGEDIPIGNVQPDENGTWVSDRFPPEVHDWLVVLKAV